MGADSGTWSKTRIVAHCELSSGDAVDVYQCGNLAPGCLYPVRRRSVPPTHLREWHGFGNDCSVEEHVRYGACLDGRCCMRHSVEKRNALRVMQFRTKRRGGTPHKQTANDGASYTMSTSTRSDEDKENSSSKRSGSTSEYPQGKAKISVENDHSGAAVAGLGIGRKTRRRTPLHFASDLGDLSLVGR